MKKEFIVQKQSDFDLIINKGKKVKGEIISIYYYPSENNKKYFGFAVSKKIGKAVIRNRIKRKLRMIVHNNENLFSNNYKYIIMINRNCFDYSHEQWNKDMINNLERINNNEKI